jgi:hypothetical protein
MRLYKVLIAREFLPGTSIYLPYYVPMIILVIDHIPLQFPLERPVMLATTVSPDNMKGGVDGK